MGPLDGEKELSSNNFLSAIMDLLETPFVALFMKSEMLVQGAHQEHPVQTDFVLLVAVVFPMLQSGYLSFKTFNTHLLTFTIRDNQRAFPIKPIKSVI